MSLLPETEHNHQSRTFGILKRLGLVLSSILTVHIAARLFWHYGPDMRSDDLLDCQNNYGDPQDWVYVPHNLSGPVLPYPCHGLLSSPWWSYHPTIVSGWLGTHVVGLALACVAGLILFWLASLTQWIFTGRGFFYSDYVDPCKNHTKCPCPRHREEEREAQDAAMLAAGVAVGAATGTISASGS